MAAGFVSSHYSRMTSNARFLAHSARPRRPPSLPYRAAGITVAHEPISARSRTAERSSLSFPCTTTANKVFGESATVMAAGFARPLSVCSPLPSSARFSAAGTAFAGARRLIAVGAENPVSSPRCVPREAGNIAVAIDEDEPRIMWIFGAIEDLWHDIKDKFVKKKPVVIEECETTDELEERPDRKRKYGMNEDEEEGEEPQTPNHKIRKIH